LTVNVLPAMVRVPTRELPVVFAAIANCTLPLPLPDAPDVIVIQGTLLTAVQVHEPWVLTLTEPVAAALPTSCDVGEIEYEQLLPVCSTVNVWPAIVSVPVRDPPERGSTMNSTVPLPLPEAPEEIVIHDTLLDAVHAHDAPAVTPTEPDPPAAENVCDVGEIAYEQLLFWVTVNVSPAMVSVPVRVAPVFAWTVNCTVPLPVPDEPEEIVIQGTLLTAVHPQPLGAVTDDEPVPPAAATVCDVGEIEYEQPLFWVTVNVCPAIISVPVRSGPVFAWTANCTVPFPVPEVPEEIVIHATLLEAVHVQEDPVVTAVEPVPPAAASVCDAGAFE
jgi:hypothetical protein